MSVIYNFVLNKSKIYMYIEYRGEFRGLQSFIMSIEVVKVISFDVILFFKFLLRYFGVFHTDVFIMLVCF
jgi:hypothetical protein